MSTITWLHLSDLHFREKTSYDENIVLRALLRDVAERIAQDRLQPDFILVSGDLAYAGKPAEYGLARRFFGELLATANLRKERLFLVPGNHDVDRDKVTQGARAIGDSLDGREEVNDILAEPDSRHLLMARFAGYAAFLNDYLGDHLPFDDERYFYVRELELAGLRLALLGLNSAWASASDEDRAKGLLVGERQVRAALDRAKGADLKIALLHHPFDRLRDFDRADVEPLLCDNCELVLHGHMHQPGLLETRSPDAEFLTVGAGACYRTRRYPNSCNWVRCNLDRGRGLVYLRMYSDRRGGFWTKDVLNYRNAPDGVFEFALPARLGGRPIRGTLVRPDRIIVLDGYTGEDLEGVLVKLREMLSAGGVDLCADVGQDRLTITAPDGSTVELSAEAARDLQPVADRQAEEGAYLTALQLNPRYGRWASQFVPLAGTLTTFERLPGWTDVPPEFTLLEMSGQGPSQQVRRVRLEDITQAMAQHEALVLLGEPGAGKTTTLYKLALEAAQRRLTTGRGRLPLLLPLAEYRGYRSPYAFVEAVWHQRLCGGDEVAGHLRRGDLFLLCDALNEMPSRDDRHYRERVGDWRHFVGEWPGNQLLFTCRSRDYGEPLGLHQVEIDPLDDGRVQDFLGRYLAPDLAREAWGRLDDSPLLDMVRNPYYLSMLAYIVSRDGTWPVGRAGMLEEFANLLLAREQTRNHPHWPGQEPLRTALSLLAEGMQPFGEGTRLARREVLARIPARVEGHDGLVETPPLAVLRLGLAATILDTERAPGDEEQVRFYHHQLQEYFAARALLDRCRAGEDLAGRWQQARLVQQMPEPGPLGDFEPLPPPPTTGWEEPTVLAAGLAPDPAAFVEAVRRANPVLAARCLVESGREWPPALVEAVQADLLRDIGDTRVHLRARIAAGEALGNLDDPRFQPVEVGGKRVLLPLLVYVPAGPFRMGSTAWQVWKLTRRDFPAQNEQPRHAVHVPAFFVGRFPVTNAEYTGFLEAGGYQQERYWPPGEARAWVRGEEVESGVLREEIRYWGLATMDPTLLKVAYEDRPRDRPAFWDSERLKNPAQPVVGVTWYEAMAYCAWLTEVLALGGWELAVWRSDSPSTLQLPDRPTIQARLPTEAEWERAARGGRARIYPWGNRWEPDRANTWEGHVWRTTPVGVYPGGSTPEGAHDLGGNVWEWTASLYKPYPYQPDDGRNDPRSEGRRVVRGGSWSYHRRYVRCAFRDRDIPVDYYDNLGFRVVVSLASSES